MWCFSYLSVKDIKFAYYADYALWISVKDLDSLIADIPT